MNEERIPTHEVANEQDAPKPDEVVAKEGLEAPASSGPQVADISREHTFSAGAGKNPDEVIDEEKLGA
jgi:hypothetical protein